MFQGNMGKRVLTTSWAMVHLLTESPKMRSEDTVINPFYKLRLEK